MRASVKGNPSANRTKTSPRTILGPVSPRARLRVRPLCLRRPGNKKRLPHTGSDLVQGSAAPEAAVFTLEIQIAAGPHVIFELFETRVIRAGMSAELPFGRLQLGTKQRDDSRGTYGSLPVFTFILTFTPGETSDTIAAWLCQKLQKRCYPLRMAINGTRTEIAAKAIARTIEKSLAAGPQTAREQQ